jgi:hypothetical protein
VSFYNTDGFMPLYITLLILLFLPLRFNVFETRNTGQGIELPEKDFPDFAHKAITWEEFHEDCINLELNKYVQPLQIISKYGSNTLKALEAFELEVLDKKYSAQEADIIL